MPSGLAFPATCPLPVETMTATGGMSLALATRERRWEFPDRSAEGQPCVLPASGWPLHHAAPSQRPGYQPPADPQNPERDPSDDGCVRGSTERLTVTEPQGRPLDRFAKTSRQRTDPAEVGVDTQRESKEQGCSQEARFPPAMPTCAEHVQQLRALSAARSGHLRQRGVV